jgi:hypothetical protein
MSCGCPDAVVYALRGRVQRELDKVLAIKNATGLFNRASKDVIGNAAGDIDSALATIPTASPLNYLDLVQYLTCPLTPLALGLSITDISALDPTIALNKVKGLRSGEIEHARSNYEGVLSSSANSGLIRIARKYVNELLRLQFNSSSFTEAVIISATVLATCGTDEYTAGPYAAFANAVTDFSFQNGVPTGLDQNAAAIVQKLLSAEAKFKALRESVV